MELFNNSLLTLAASQHANIRTSRRCDEIILTGALERRWTTSSRSGNRFRHRPELFSRAFQKPVLLLHSGSGIHVLNPISAGNLIFLALSSISNVSAASAVQHSTRSAKGRVITFQINDPGLQMNRRIWRLDMSTSGPPYSTASWCACSSTSFTASRRLKPQERCMMGNAGRFPRTSR